MSQTRCGRASSSRKNVVSRERERSSVTTRRIGCGSTGGSITGRSEVWQAGHRDRPGGRVGFCRNDRDRPPLQAVRQGPRGGRRDVRRRGRPRSPGSSARTAPGRRRRCARCSASSPPRRARPRSSAGRSARWTTLRSRSAPSSRPRASTPGAADGTTCVTVAAAAGIPRSRVEEVLELVELKDAAKRRVKTYSLGMRAAALPRDRAARRPAGARPRRAGERLDPEGMRWLRTFLRGLAAEGRTMLVSSHVLAELAQTADDIVIRARAGSSRTRRSASCAARRAHPLVRTPETDRLREHLASRRHRGHARGRRRAAAWTAPPERIGEIAAAKGSSCTSCGTEESSLEEVFLELTGSEEARPG